MLSQSSLPSPKFRPRTVSPPSRPTRIHRYQVTCSNWIDGNALPPRFNLGISYINLAQYPLAAQRILDALRLQHADATEGYAGTHSADVQNKTSVKGVTSETLWDTLRNTCMQ